MRWRGRRQSTNISDQRGQGPARLPGGFGRGGPRIPIPIGRGGGIGGIVLIVALFILLPALGINPGDILGGGQGPAPQTTQQRQQPGNDEQAQFVGVVLAETEDVWNGIFQTEGENYEEPTLVMFDGAVDSVRSIARTTTRSISTSPSSTSSQAASALRAISRRPMSSRTRSATTSRT